MEQKLSYTFKSNGWEHRIKLIIPIQETSSEEIESEYEIIGISEGHAIINLSEGKLYFNEPINIKSYKDDGKNKILKSIKIPKFILWQIETK